MVLAHPVIACVTPRFNSGGWDIEREGAINKRHLRAASHSVERAELSGKEKAWRVAGYAATTGLGSDGAVVTKEALERSIARGDLTNRTTVLFNHDANRPIGHIERAELREQGLWIEVVLDKDEKTIWEKAKSGTLRCFSIRGSVKEHHSEYDKDLNRSVKYVDDLEIVEVSVVSVPGDPGSKIVEVVERKAKPIPGMARSGRAGQRLYPLKEVNLMTDRARLAALERAIQDQSDTLTKVVTYLQRDADDQDDADGAIDYEVVGEMQTSEDGTIAVDGDYSIDDDGRLYDADGNEVYAVDPESGEQVFVDFGDGEVGEAQDEEAEEHAASWHAPMTELSRQVSTLTDTVTKFVESSPMIRGYSLESEDDELEPSAGDVIDELLQRSHGADGKPPEMTGGDALRIGLRHLTSSAQ